jgi:hypothetical protein
LGGCYTYEKSNQRFKRRCRFDTKAGGTIFADVTDRLSKYETGENDIPTVIWEHLADFYGVSVDYLMGRTDEKKPYPKGNR